MKLTLNESSRKFTNTLAEADRAKLVFTESAVESDDESGTLKICVSRPLS